MPGAAGGRTEVPSRLQVAMSFVTGFAVFGFGTVATWSWMSGGPLHGRGWWQLAAGLPYMIVGIGLILGGGFGGLEAREAPKGDAGDPSSANDSC